MIPNSLLISPYWNVNYMIDELQLLKDSLLISPYWNVNFILRMKGISLPTFNLSILECKYGQNS